MELLKSRLDNGVPQGGVGAGRILTALRKMGLAPRDSGNDSLLMDIGDEEVGGPQLKSHTT